LKFDFQSIKPTVNNKRIVIKVGSNVLTMPNGDLDILRLKIIVNQIFELKKNGVDVILVSSGAVAAGRSILQKKNITDSVLARQVFASVGQVKLLGLYADAFAEVNVVASQVLVTKEDFRDKTHYFNMKGCFEALLKNEIIPIVNENDVVSVTELMFTDNDELAALISAMVNADALFILSNVDGIYNGDPKNQESRIINKIDSQVDFSKYVTASKSGFGRGGMITKSKMAGKVAKNGIMVKIANGKKDNIILDMYHDTNYEVGTTFVPMQSTSQLKKRIAFSESYAVGTITINEGAKNALLSRKATSLLTVGVTKIEGQFQKGDLLKIVDEKNNIVGIGKAEYNYKKALENLGIKNVKPIIHYDYLFLY
jgi:glutamate 5-kinase